MHLENIADGASMRDGDGLIGPGQDFLRSLGAFGRALLAFRPAFAAMCPNLVSEADRGLMRRA